MRARGQEPKVENQRIKVSHKIDFIQTNKESGLYKANFISMILYENLCKTKEKKCENFQKKSPEKKSFFGP